MDAPRCRRGKRRFLKIAQSKGRPQEVFSPSSCRPKKPWRGGARPEPEHAGHVRTYKFLRTKPRIAKDCQRFRTPILRSMCGAGVLKRTPTGGAVTVTW